MTVGRWRALGRELKTPIALLDALGRRFSWHHMPSLAAGLAFYFLLAFFPFLLFLVAVVTLVPGVEGLMDWLFQTAAQFVPPEAWGLVEGSRRDTQPEKSEGRCAQDPCSHRVTSIRSCRGCNCHVLSPRRG